MDGLPCKMHKKCIKNNHRKFFLTPFTNGFMFSIIKVQNKRKESPLWDKKQTLL